MKETDKVLWNAYCETGDYFSRLGGSGRYPGFAEYHIPALVLILAIENVASRAGQHANLRHLLPGQMWTETDGLPSRVIKIISGLTSPEPGLLRSFVEYVSATFKKKTIMEARQWELFVKQLEGVGWHI